jgi:thiol-disulfide isomerase/thioredoxin
MPKRNSRSKKSKAKANDGIDVATDADVPKLEALLKKNPIVLILIHADWCGHCQTFKPQWEEYKKMSGRKVPMASVNEKVLAKTALKNAKIDGFPSTVVYSGKDGSFGSFKNDKGEETNSVPNIRDKEIMTKILRAKPSMLKRVNEIDSESAHPTPNAEALLEASGKKAVKEKDIPTVNLNAVNPPNVAADTLRRTRRKR